MLWNDINSSYIIIEQGVGVFKLIAICVHLGVYIECAINILAGKAG